CHMLPRRKLPRKQGSLTWQSSVTERFFDWILPIARRYIFASPGFSTNGAIPQPNATSSLHLRRLRASVPRTNCCWSLFPKSPGRNRLRKQRLNDRAQHLSVNIGQAEIAPAETVGEFLMVQAQLVQDCRP